MRNHRKSLFGAAALLCLGFTNADAMLITSADSFTTPADVIDFSDRTVQEITTGPTGVGSLIGRDVVFSATNTFDSAGFTASLYGLGSNGLWGDGRTFAWVNPGAIATMRFLFQDAPVAEVGGFLNYCIDNFGSGAGCGTGGVTLRALDSSFNVLESYRLDLLAPSITASDSFNAGAFRGISRASADIFAFEISGASVLDDLTFTSLRTRVSEPGSIVLMMWGLFALVVQLRRR